MSEERTSRRSFLRTLGVFAAAGIGVLGFPATAWAAEFCCPNSTKCPGGGYWCQGNCCPTGFCLYGLSGGCRTVGCPDTCPP